MRAVLSSGPPSLDTCVKGGYGEAARQDPCLGCCCPSGRDSTAPLHPDVKDGRARCGPNPCARLFPCLPVAVLRIQPQPSTTRHCRPVVPPLQTHTLKSLPWCTTSSPRWAQCAQSWDPASDSCLPRAHDASALINFKPAWVSCLCGLRSSGPSPMPRQRLPSPSGANVGTPSHVPSHAVCLAPPHPCSIRHGRLEPEDTRDSVTSGASGKAGRQRLQCASCAGQHRQQCPQRCSRLRHRLQHLHEGMPALPTTHSKACEAAFVMGMAAAGHQGRSTARLARPAVHETCPAGCQARRGAPHFLAYLFGFLGAPWRIRGGGRGITPA